MVKTDLELMAEAEMRLRRYEIRYGKNCRIYKSLAKLIKDQKKKLANQAAGAVKCG